MDDRDLFADVTEHDGKTWDNDLLELFFLRAESQCEAWKCVRPISPAAKQMVAVSVRYEAFPTVSSLRCAKPELCLARR